MTSLDTRGVRESHLRVMLQRIETSFKENVRRDMKYSSSMVRSGPTLKTEVDFDPDSASFGSSDSAVSGLNSDSIAASSTFRIELGRNETEKKSALARYQDFQRWMWEECFNALPLRALKLGKMRCKRLSNICDACFSSYRSEETHCPSCHQAVNPFSESLKSQQRDVKVFDSSFPLGITLLKALFALVEVRQR